MTSLVKIAAALCVVTSLACIAPPATAETTAEASGQPLFENDQLLNLRIEAPLSSLFKELLNADEYVKGTIYFAGADGVERSLSIKVKPRGKSRRDKKMCRFPPLTINFKKDATSGTIFEGQNKLKLVTHCQNKSKTYHQYYLQEHVIYKTYNLMTEESFSVRLAKIDYIDTEDKQSVSGKYGFFIEDASRLADRIGATRQKVEKIPSSAFDTNAAARFAVFQFFIGNLDWAMLGASPGNNCCHNSKAYLTASGKSIPVPYDFDFAGLINARYALPPDRMGVSSVRERAYRGFCKHNDGIEAALQLFKDNKEAIYALAQNPAYLNERSIKSMTKYYNSFYKIIENPNKTQKALYDRCR